MLRDGCAIVRPLMISKALVRRVLAPFAAAPSVGDVAPRVRARAHDGREIDLRDFRGRYLVLYFYPKAFTHGCTVETRQFREHFAEIEALGATVIGVSPDPQQLQCDFAKHHALPFALIADEHGVVCNAFGATRNLVPLTKRITFVIDPQGRIAARFHHELNVGRHVERVVAFLEAERDQQAAAQ
jgi:peroxiredoxin Q/BCP